MYAPGHWFSSSRTAAEYYEDHLISGDYYRQGVAHELAQDLAPSGLFGGLAAELVPSGRLDKDTFTLLAEGVHPVTGEPLFQRKRANRRAAVDITVSPHKSVSVACRVGGDARILGAMQRASAASRAFLVSQAAVRRQGAGLNAYKPAPGMVVGAYYLHDTSRPVEGKVDPQIHEHNVFFNISRDPDTGKWVALETAPMFLDGAMERAGLIFQSELAKELRGLGYEITFNARGEVVIPGIGEDVCLEFSQRTQQIERAVAEREKEVGRELTEKEKNLITLNTREQKRVHDGEPIRAEDLRQEQLGRLTDEQRARVLGAVEAARERGPIQEVEYANVSDVVALALGHMTARQSVFKPHEMIAWAMKTHLGRVDHADIVREIEFLKREGVILDFGGKVGAWTTREMLSLETAMIDVVKGGMAKELPICPGREVPRMDVGGRFELNDEQRKAVEHLWNVTDFCTVIRGKAGTGKSSCLLSAVDGMTKSGRTVRLLAPTGTAVEELKTASQAAGDPFANADTVQGLLASKEKQGEISKGDIIILDEAGLMGVRDMNAFLTLCRERGARVVLVGDVKQHLSVPAGDALRLLEDKSGVKIVELERINRQRTEAMREASWLAANHRPGEALDKLIELNQVVEIENAGERTARLASDFVDSISSGKSAIVVAPTWKEIDSATLAIRAELLSRGMIDGTQHKVILERAIRDDEAERLHTGKLEEGMVITSQGRGIRQLAAGRWLITGFSGNKRHVHVARMNEDGSAGSETMTVDFHALKVADSRKLQIAQRRETHIAVGDRIWIRQIEKKVGVKNGMTGVVTGVDADGNVTFRDDKTEKEITLPPSFRAFEHGYAFTSHGSQGRTVDEAFLSYGADSKALTRNAFYVSSTRHKALLRVYTSSIADLRQWISKPGDRLSATELRDRYREVLRAEREAAGLRPQVEKDVTKFQRVSPKMREKVRQPLRESIRRLEKLETVAARKPRLRREILRFLSRPYVPLIARVLSPFLPRQVSRLPRVIAEYQLLSHALRELARSFGERWRREQGVRLHPTPEPRMSRSQLARSPLGIPEAAPVFRMGESVTLFRPRDGGMRLNRPKPIIPTDVTQDRKKPGDPGPDLGRDHGIER